MVRRLILLLFAFGLGAVACAQQEDIIVNLNTNVSWGQAATSFSMSCNALSSASSASGTSGSFRLNTRMIPGFPYRVLLSATNHIPPVGGGSSGAGGAVLNISVPPGYTVILDDIERRSRFVSFDAHSTANQQVSIKVRVLPVNENLEMSAGMATSLSTDKTLWILSLGSLSNGKYAGRLSFANLSSTQSLASMFSPYNLFCDSNNSQVTVVNQFDTAGIALIRQVIAPQVVVDVIYASTTSLLLKCYHPSNRSASPGAGGIYSLSGNPFALYTVSIGASDSEGVSISVDYRDVSTDTLARTMVTSLTRTGSSPNYNWTAVGWHLNSANAVFSQTRATTGIGEVINIVDNTKSPAQTTTTKSRTFFSSSDALLALQAGTETIGSTNTVTTSMDYYTDRAQSSYGLPLSITNSNSGSSNIFTYTGTAAQVSSQSAPFKDTNGQAVTDITYTQDSFGTSTRPLSVSLKIGGVQVTGTDYSYDDSFSGANYVAAIYPYASHSQVGVVTEIRTDATSNSSANSLITITRRFSENAGALPTQLSNDDFFANLTYSVKSPNGVKESFVYRRGNWIGTTLNSSGNAGIDYGPASRITSIVGASSASTGAVYYTAIDGCSVDPVYLIPGKSTRTDTIRDNYARIVRSEIYVYADSDWQLLSWTNLSYNNFNQLVSRTNSTGASYSASYSGERLTSETNELGVTSTYTYDAAGRVQTITAAGSTKTFQYDGAGHVVKQTVTGAGESLITTWIYDDAGRLSSESTPEHGTVAHSYNPASLSHTASYPSTAQQTEQAYLDGQPKSVTGSFCIARYFDYGVESDGRRFTVANSGSATSSRWTKSWTDWAGRDIKIVNPDPSVLGQTGTGGAGTVVTTTKSYDSQGRLSSVATTGRATTFYQYDELSQLARKGLDVNNSSGLTLLGSDRIVDSSRYIEKVQNSWWYTTVAKTYPYFGSDTAVTLSTTRQRLTGFANGVVEEIQQTDADGNVGSRVTTLDSSQATTTTSSTTPGLNDRRTETLSIQSGMTKTYKDYDGLSGIENYDALARLSSIVDKRGNTTSYHYVTGTSLVDKVTDASSQSTSFGYDTMGRQSYVSNPLGQKVYSEYSLRNQVVHQWGDGTYPVAYGYDSFGQRTSLSTYRSKSSGSWSQASWPSSPPTAGDTTVFSFDEATGVLTNRTDSAGKSTSYTYNSLGQTATVTSPRGIAAHYSYDASTSELKSVSYDSYTDPDASRGSISTPSVNYTYTRLGQPATIDEGLIGTRSFDYDPNAPWRLSKLRLPAFFGNRTYTPIYESTTSSIDGTLLGRAVGFDIASVSNDLHKKLTISNLGRIAAINSRTANATAVDFNFAYKSDGALDGYSSGNFALSRVFESNRNLVTQVKSSWAGAAVTQFDYTYNVIGLQQYAQQSGSAYSSYGGAIFRAFSYNKRGELETTAMYNGTAPTTGAPNPGLELPGRRFEFRYDDIGNRSSSGETGSVSSGDESYTPNSLNQYTSKDNTTVRVLGTALSGAKVSAFSSDRQIVSFTSIGNSFGGDLVPKITSGPATGTIDIYGSPSSTLAISKTTRRWFFPGLVQSFSYDADGNLISDGIKNYFYDAKNQLVKIVTTTAAANAGYVNQILEFKYDYIGRRVEKKVTTYPNGTSISTRFIYDGWELVAEIDGTNSATLRTFTWGTGALLQIHDLVAGKVLLPTVDANGNIAALVNSSSGASEALYEYGPFGELLHAEGAYADANPFRFGSNYQDDESGLIYYGYRYYSPSLGRFINQDPIGESGGLNLYDLCGNDSVNHADSLGLSWASQLHHYITDTVLGNAGPLGHLLEHADHWVSSTAGTLMDSPVFTTIVGVALNFVPGVGPLLALAWNAAIGYRTGGVEGMLIGIGSSAIGGAIGGKIAGALVKNLAIKGLTAAVIRGAITGAFAGAASSFATGGSIWAGALIGAVAGGVITGGSYAIENGTFGPRAQSTYQNARQNFGNWLSRVKRWFFKTPREGRVEIGRIRFPDDPDWDANPYVQGSSSNWQLARLPATFGGDFPELIPNDAYGLAKDQNGRLMAINPRNGRAILIPDDVVSDFTRLRPAEIDTMIRARQQLGLDLYDSPHEGAEYVDAAGRSFDQMGSPESAMHWNAKQFSRSIDWHLTKSNNYTIIDLTGYSAAQKATVSSYLSNLPSGQQAKIIKIGF